MTPNPPNPTREKSLVDSFTSFIMDPSNKNRSSPATAWIATIGLGIITGGLVHVGSALWRAKYDNEENETHAKLSLIF
ncbi:MAG: hypothetical protein H0X29_08720 [Parachlamydiaceae bacterium]|nr:hypothetical protein [Parachlamydiaceae bacterium]